jgi:Family of unknown function (DUF6459)
MPDPSDSKRDDSLSQPPQPSPVPERKARHRPLPGAVAVRQVPVPGQAPLFDDETSEPPAEPAPAADARPGRLARPPAASVPAPGQIPWPSQFAQVLAETLAGARPPGQLVPWTTAQARRRISKLGPLLAAASQPRIRRVIVTSPARDVVEMTVVVGFGSGVRALAVRMERDGTARGPQQPGTSPRQPAGPALPPEVSGRWCCTAVEAA